MVRKLLLLALLAAGCASAPPPAATPTPPTIVNESTPGERCDFEADLPKTGPVLVEFYSLNCPPCREVAPFLEKLAQARPDLAIRKLNIDRRGAQGIDFDSPLAQQYHLDRVPFFVVYDNGVRKMDGDAAKDQVRAWMRESGVAQ